MAKAKDAAEAFLAMAVEMYVAETERRLAYPSGEGWRGMGGDEFARYMATVATDEFISIAEERRATAARLKRTRGLLRDIDKERARFAAAVRADAARMDDALLRVIEDMIPAFLRAADAAIGEMIAKKQSEKEASKEEAAKAAMEAATKSSYGMAYLKRQYQDEAVRASYAAIPHTRGVKQLMMTASRDFNSKVSEDGVKVTVYTQEPDITIVIARRYTDDSGKQAELKKKDITAATSATMAQILIEVGRAGELDHNLPRVRFPLSEWMAFRGLKDKKFAARQLIEECELLIHATITEKTKRRGIRVYATLQSAKVYRGMVTVTLTADFYEELRRSYNLMMPFPLEVLRVPLKDNPAGYYMGVALAWNKFENIGKAGGVENYIDGKQAMRMAQNVLPTAEEVRKSGRHITQQTIDPVFTALRNISNLYGGEGNVGFYWKSSAKRMTDEEMERATADAFTGGEVFLRCKSFENYPDTDYIDKVRERQAAWAKRQAAGASDKKAASENAQTGE